LLYATRIRTGWGILYQAIQAHECCHAPRHAPRTLRQGTTGNGKVRALMCLWHHDQCLRAIEPPSVSQCTNTMCSSTTVHRHSAQTQCTDTVSQCTDTMCSSTTHSTQYIAVPHQRSVQRHIVQWHAITLCAVRSTQRVSMPQHTGHSYSPSALSAETQCTVTR
jgi:hypothetical protein